MMITEPQGHRALQKTQLPGNYSPLSFEAEWKLASLADDVFRTVCEMKCKAAYLIESRSVAR